MELQGFKYYLIQEGKKPGTVQFHCNNFSRLLKECPSLSLTEVMSFILLLKEKNLSSCYVNKFIATLRIYGQYKQTTLYNELRFYKVQKTVKATMSEREIEDFLALPCVYITRPHGKSKKLITYQHDVKGYARWTLFFKILAYSGMRCGEVAQLTVEAVDFGRKVFVLYDTKTNTPRYVPIAPSLLHDLTEHLKSLEGKYLFPAKGGGFITQESWGVEFRKRIKRLGITRTNLTPYSLRHSFITRMLDEDINLFKVQKIVGHKRIQTTADYMHLTTKDITKTIAKDPLSRQSLTYEERFKQFREGVRELLQSFALTVEEEKEMLKAV